MARPSLLAALFGRARSSAPVPVAEVAADRKVAAVELHAAQEAVAAAEAAYGVGLLDLSADLPALDEGRRAAARKLDQAKALMRALDEKNISSQAAERQAELDRIVAEADAKASAFRDQVETDLPLIGTAVRNLVRGWAEAEAARQDANRALAAAEASEPRPDVEIFRALTGRPRQVLQREEFEAYCRENGTIAGYYEQVIKQSDGIGYFRAPSANHAQRYYHKRRFERLEVLDAESARVPATLIASLAVPGLRAGDQPNWSPMPGASPAQVLAALDALEHSATPEDHGVDRRKPVMTEPRAIGPVHQVAEPERTPNYRAS